MGRRSRGGVLKSEEEEGRRGGRCGHRDEILY